VFLFAWRWWGIIVYVFGAGLAALWLSFFMAMRYGVVARGEPGRFNAELEALCERTWGAPDAPNSWDDLITTLNLRSRISQELYDDAGEKPRDWPDGFDWPVDAEAFDNGVPPEPVRRHVERIVEAQREAGVFRRLASVTDIRRAVRPQPARERIIDIRREDVGSARGLARANRVRMYMAHGAGDDRELLIAFEQSMALGRLYARQADLFEWLAGNAIHLIALGEVQRELRVRPPAPEVLRGMGAAVARFELPRLSVAMEAERFRCLDAIEWTHTDGPGGDGRLVPGVLDEIGEPSSELTAIFVAYKQITGPTKRQSVERLNTLFEEVRTVLEHEIDERLTHVPRIDHSVNSLKEEDYFVLAIFIPSLAKAVRAEVTCQLRRAALVLSLALEDHRARHGTYPPSLEALDAPDFPGLPLARGVAEQVRYGLRNDAGGTPRPFIYAIGADGQDDAGTEAESDPARALMPGHDGSDFILVCPECPK